MWGECIDSQELVIKKPHELACADPLLSPSGAGGVTTIIMGNCGVGAAPCRKEDRDFMVHLLEGVEDIPAASINAGTTPPNCPATFPIHRLICRSRYALGGGGRRVGDLPRVLGGARQAELRRRPGLDGQPRLRAHLRAGPRALQPGRRARRGALQRPDAGGEAGRRGLRQGGHPGRGGRLQHEQIQRPP